MPENQQLKGINDVASPVERVAMDAFGLLQQVDDAAENLREIAASVAVQRVLIVNVCYIGASGGRWLLIDTGLPESGGGIVAAAANRFGQDSRPEAIFLTHGHFDHVGSVIELARHWNVPVYAHPEEFPYLTGRRDYPPPDTAADPGLMAKLSPLYPHDAIDLGSLLKPIPADGQVPGFPDWRWLHTPGHTPGHVSLFRERDRVLIAGDAFTTVKQESAVAVLSQDKEVHGPPSYFTMDWQTAWQSVKKLESLKPSVVATGHGQPLAGESLRSQLAVLAEDFDNLAMPH